MAQAFGDQAVVDPALVPGAPAAMPHQLDDGDDDQELQADQEQLQDRMVDIGADHGDQHRQCSEEVRQHVGVA